MAPQPVLLSAKTVAAHGIHIKKSESAFRENSATIVMPSKEAAFLNPVQEFNRDLSTLAITAWSERLDREKRLRFDERNRARSRRGDAPPEAKRAKTEEDDQDAGASREYHPYTFKALEALAATGLRSIRYAKEIPLLRSIVANDLSHGAVQAMERNLALNFPPGKPLDHVAEVEQEDEMAQEDLEDAARSGATAHRAPENKPEEPSAPGAADASDGTGPRINPECKIHINRGDAISLMYAHRELPKRFDMIDLDPYGTAAPFLDSAVQSVADGGLLCVTCTDLAVLTGHNYPEKCWSLYGGVSVKAEYSHEVALRLVLHAIAMAAGRYGRYVQPMLSLSIDFYLRVFVRVWTRPETVKLNAANMGLVYTCSRCSDFHLQPMGRAGEVHNEKTGSTYWKYGSASGPPTNKTCEQCGGNFHVGGPMWLGALHDPDFCDEMLEVLDRGTHNLATEARIRGMVSTARDEIEAPFYFHPAKIAGLFHCASPALAPVVSTLLNAGFEVSRSHCVAGSVKTNASRGQILDMMRCWIRTHPVKEERLKEGSAAKGLLERRTADGQPVVQHEFEFDKEHPDTDEVINGTNESQGRLVRYQMNPQANWGPGTAAKGHRTRQRRSFAPSELARRAAIAKETTQ